ncbi:hypothetical protein FMUND_10353 [Fusarium mundagurra]|uniref:Uncharacterized protein n=1 Tax=Fusarium mundagurra TaxID=1567541 RepID=A0A8H5YA84_9HYPO|nr:hypothetical protein FMUND_10353 [Fusarium mundagurra]
MPYVYKPWILKSLGVPSWEHVRMMGAEGLREEKELRQELKEKLKAEQKKSDERHVSSETPVKEPEEKHDVLSGQESGKPVHEADSAHNTKDEKKGTTEDYNEIRDNVVMQDQYHSLLFLDFYLVHRGPLSDLGKGGKLSG